MPFAALAAAVLSGCGGSSGTGRDAPVQVPPGIVVGSAAGIYPAGGQESCCWTGPDVRFQVAAGGTPKTLRLYVYEPKVGAFADRLQVVSLLDARGNVIASRRVPAGDLVNVAFPLAPADLKGGTVNVHLRMQTSYVPKDAGLGPDLRRLALIIKEVSAQ